MDIYNIDIDIFEVDIDIIDIDIFDIDIIDIDIDIHLGQFRPHIVVLVGTGVTAGLGSSWRYITEIMRAVRVINLPV